MDPPWTEAAHLCLPDVRVNHKHRAVGGRRNCPAAGGDAILVGPASDSLV